MLIEITKISGLPMVTYQCVLPSVRTSCTQVYHHAFSEVLTTDSIEVLQTYLGTELQNLLVRFTWGCWMGCWGLLG